MASKTFSIRLTNAEVELLQEFQDPHGETLNQTVARLVRDIIGANTDVNTANTTINNANIEEMITQAVNAIAPDWELIKNENDSRTAYLVTAMNEIKSQLENKIEFLKTRVKHLEQNQEEKITQSPVTTEVTTQDVALSLLQDELEDAIAPEATEENIDPAMPLLKSPKKRVNQGDLTHALNLVRGRLSRPRKVNRLQITDKEIKAKILELYPDPQKCFNEEGISLIVEAITEESKKAIAPKVTEQNLFPAKRLKSVATSIQNTFRDRGIKISRTDIAAKVLKMYPDPDCWFPRCAAREDVVEALEKEHTS